MGFKKQTNNLQCPKCLMDDGLEYLNKNYSCHYCLVEWDKETVMYHNFEDIFRS